MPRTYPAIEIRFTPDAQAESALHDRLLAALDDFAPTAVDEAATVWRVFFDSSSDRDAAVAHLAGLADVCLAVQPLDVADDDWARRSQMDLQPIRVGHIVVTPPWAREAVAQSAGGDDQIIVVVPSTGFGTGHHASTRLCLALLQQVMVRGRSVLDVGTGSGVLALAAARLGAREVVALDNDRDALDAARENVALNQAGEIVRLELGDLRAVDRGPTDIVLANLSGSLLRRAAGCVVGRLRSNGDAIVSGVLGVERTAVIAAFEQAGARLVREEAEDEWVGLHFQPTDRPR